MAELTLKAKVRAMRRLVREEWARIWEAEEHDPYPEFSGDFIYKSAQRFFNRMLERLGITAWDYMKTIDEYIAIEAQFTDGEPPQAYYDRMIESI
ncbi:MAG: hypothetical protein K6T83_03725 [Alicyclobacillus sp.]|nr:hypothetical protein [Alicyclobacillus sp.]